MKTITEEAYNKLHHLQTNDYVKSGDNEYTFTPIGLKHDQGKARISLIPPIAIKAMAEVLTFGAEKYEPNSWQTVPNGKERYTDAMLRHIYAYLDGEQTDKESGLGHLAHAITNMAFILHFEEN